jgi:hypothetical protein
LSYLKIVHIVQSGNRLLFYFLYLINFCILFCLKFSFPFLPNISALSYGIAEPFASNRKKRLFTIISIAMKKTFCRPVLDFLIFFLFSLTAAGQNTSKTYNEQWKIVEDFQKEGLSRSAFQEVKKIYLRAKTGKHEDQLIKAIIYIAGLQAENRELNEILSIQEIEKEIAVNKEPVKSILYSIQAAQYYNYFQNNRWKLYQRTQTSNFKTDDITTWDISHFQKKISTNYLLSVKNEALIKRIPLSTYDEILKKGNSRILRPTLYDLLSHEALKYFSSGDNMIRKPFYAFEINSASAFDPASGFVKTRFETKDTTASEYYALKLYQKLIAFHLNDQKPDALIDLDLHRLQYVYRKSVHPGKDSLYLHALNNLITTYKNAPAAAQAIYLTAAFYNEKGSQFRVNTDTASRFLKVKAREICKKIIRESPSTEGGINASSLLNKILRVNMAFTTEDVNIPEKPFRVMVEYNNFSKLFLKVVKATDEIKRSLRNRYVIDSLHLLTSAPPVRSWEQDLPDTKDHQTHRVEIKVDALPIGEYVLIASTKADFSSSNLQLGAKLLYISNISFILDSGHYFILNRDTGAPLVNAKVRFWESNPNPDILSLEKPGQLFTTDSHGYFKINAEP